MPYLLSFLVCINGLASVVNNMLTVVVFETDLKRLFS